MSGLDGIVNALTKIGENPGMLAVAPQVADMFGNIPAIGALGKAATTLVTVDALVRAASGGKHSVLGAAAQAVQKAGPKFTQVIETCMGAACSAPGQESKLQAAVAGLKGHLDAGAAAVANGAKTAVAHVSGKGTARA